MPLKHANVHHPILPTDCAHLRKWKQMGAHAVLQQLLLPALPKAPSHSCALRNSGCFTVAVS